MLHVHLSHAALTGPTDGCAELARLDEKRGPVTAEQVRTWCGTPDATVTVRPVLDLAEHIHVDAYEASERLKAQVALRDLVCVFPYCTRPAHRCDLDHRQAHADGGPTCSCNLAPLCRSHHRAKTHGGWTYTVQDTTTYRWRSPHGHTYLRDHTGTLDTAARSAADPADPEP